MCDKFRYKSQSFGRKSGRRQVLPFSVISVNKTRRIKMQMMEFIIFFSFVSTLNNPLIML